MREHGHTQPLETYELLSTKLALPRPRPSLVPREPLLAGLDEGLQHKLILLSAPAGFGKTTLVSEWLAARGELQEPLAAAWVSLDAGDNDPARFWRYIITTCQAFDTAVGESSLTLLGMARRLPLETMLTAFINELAQISSQSYSTDGPAPFPGWIRGYLTDGVSRRLDAPASFPGWIRGYLTDGVSRRLDASASFPGWIKGVIVLEDYHVITSPQIHEGVTYLLDHLPAMLHLLVITRADPPLPLARLRAHDDLYELHAADLRFSLEETRAFLSQALPFPLSTEAIMRLEARTEGWVTGLRLLALALQGRKDPHEREHMLVSFTGSHRHILEYLVADVLSSQPEALQEFLLQTVFLNRLTAPLCDAITGRNDSEYKLEQLERANLFLIPLDDTGQWYRYHALFAEAMQHEARRRLGEDYLRSLYDKASLWYEEHGLLAEAVEIALSAGDFVRAAALIERIIELHSIFNELHTLMRWFEQLPAEVLRSHPNAAMTYAIAILYTLDRSDPAVRSKIQTPLEMAELYWQAEDNRPKLGEALAVRSQVAWWQGDLEEAFAAARRALELLPEQETLWRGSSMLNLGIGELIAGKLDAARRAALEARALFEAVGNPYGVRAATYTLGEISSRQGELHAAARLYQLEIAAAEEDPLDLADALIGLAALSYEWNELERAEQELSRALELGRHHLNEIGKYHTEQCLQIPASLVLARVLHARGETGRAQQLLQELIVLTEERKWQYLYREVLACQAQINLSAGDLAAVQRWLNTRAQLGEDFRLIHQEQEALVVARLLIAQGEPSESLRLLERWQVEAHAQGRTRSELEIQVLIALAHFSHKHLPQARQTLKEALSRAQTEGYQRLFLDEGEAMATLLRSILAEIKEEPLLTYVRTILLNFARERQGRSGQEISSPPPAGLLFEPLSPQEQRVLRLLAAGRSNPEIAQELVVSINTVKTQVQSIYRKLNVNSRWEARESARHLKLL